MVVVSYKSTGRDSAMIDFRTYAVFGVAAFAVIASPGPDILYVLSRSISSGKRIGCISALGIATGEVLHTLFAVLGLAALIQASTVAFLVLKYVGAVYLIYLGIKAMREHNQIDLQALGVERGWRVFRQGVLTNVFNPKAVLFYLTFLPQFVNPIHGHAQLQLVSLGITFAVLDVMFLLALACCAGQVNAWLKRKPQNAERARLATGTLLVGLGLRLAFAERN
jgi:RhtB (resistance to homoserine/threonine) family protein